MPTPIAPAGQKGDGTLGGMIPVHNPKALLSYYLGLFSLFPAFGFFLGAAAVVLGVQGLKLHKQHPEVRGKAHAIVGLVCGTLFGGFNLLLLIVIALAFLNRSPTQ